MRNWYVMLRNDNFSVCKQKLIFFLCVRFHMYSHNKFVMQVVNLS